MTRKDQRIFRFWRLLAVIVWIAATLPPGGAVADITYDDGLTHTVNSDISDVNETVGATPAGVGTTLNQGAYTNTFSGDLTLGRDTGSSGNYSLSGSGSLSAATEYAGYSGTGTFTQSGGTNTATGTLTLGYNSGASGSYALSGGSNTVTGNLYLGYFSGASGTYNLSDGSLAVSSNEFVGMVGSGAFTQSGGTQTVSHNLCVGEFGTGTYSLSGGSLSVVGSAYIGDGPGGSGVFTQSGGTHTAGDALYLGDNASASGSYNLSGGSLSASYNFVGVSGSGAFTQTGGTQTLSTGLYLGIFSGASGTYSLSGTGSLATANEYIGRGSGASGSFTQNGGTNTVVNGLYLGQNSGSSGSYTLNNGSLSANTEKIGDSGSGTFTQNGGSHTVSGILTLAANSGSSGSYALSGGSLTAGTINLNAGGIFNQTGGSLNATTFNQQGGEVQGSLENRGTFNYSSGTFSGRLLNYGAVNFNADFTAGNGLANYSSTTLAIGAGRTVTLNGQGLTNEAAMTLAGTLTATQEFIGNSGTGTFTQNGGTNTVNGTLTLAANSGSSGTYNLSGGCNLSANYELVGSSGSGTFTQSGGSNSVAVDLHLGRYAGGSGTYTLSGTGSLTAGGHEFIGYSGTGSFTQSGGTHSLSQDLYLGYAASSNGTYNLSNGSVEVAQNGYVGFSGSGAFTQSGGSHTVTSDIYLGYDSSGSGVYNLSGTGRLAADMVFVGFNGAGTFTQSGGTHLSNGLWLGMNSGASGTYSLSGGELGGMSESIGISGSGAFTQTGGTHSPSVYALGENSDGIGTYNLIGGSLSAAQGFVGFDGSGTFTQSGGTHTLDDGCDSGELILGQNPGSSGTYNLSGGSLSAAYECIGVDGSGTFTQTGGTHTIHNSCGTGGLAVGPGGTGTYNLSGGTLTTDGEYIGFGGTGIFTQSGGSHTTVEIYLADSCGSGTYNLQGGSLTAGAVYLNAGGVFNQTGGSLTVTTFNQQGGEVQGSLENRGTFNYDSGTFSGRLLNYGTVNLNANFTAANGLANYAAFNIDSGRTVTLNGSGLDNQGSLAVNGTLDGSGILAGSGTLLNNTGGTLSGSGTILGNLTNSGTVNPGNSPGTLTIAGDYTQTASGVLTVEIASASSYDILNVSGTASLAGKLRPVLLGGYVPQNHQVFANVVTAGSLNGSFSRVTNFTPTLVGIPRYSATSVDLLVARDYTNSYLNLTPNQRAVGNMLNGLANGATGDLENILHTIDSLPDPSAVAGAYQQISPDKAASLATLGFAGANLFRQGLANRITNLRYGGLGGGGGLGGLGGLGLSGSRLDGLMLAYNSSNLAGLITAKKKAEPESRWGLYLDPGLMLGSQKTTVNQTGYNFTIAGFTAGADYRVTDDLLVGLATGYSHTGADFRGSGGSVENNTWPLTAYAAYLPESFYAYGSLGYALNLFSLERQLSFGDLSRKASSSPTGHQFNAYGEAGYDVKANALVMTPLVSLAYSRVWVARFTESGAGSLNLEVASQQVDSLQTGVGAKIAVPLKRNGVTVVPQVYATYQHEFSHNSRGLDARLSQGSTFTFQTEQLGEDFAVAGASVTIMSQKNFSLQLNYNAEVGRAHYTAHTINTGVRWEF